jgi:hypothetical protein
MKDSFYEELDGVFIKFPKYHMKVLLWDFSAKVGREDIFKPTIGSDNLHAISNGNGLRVVNFVTSKNLIAKSVMFPQHKIHKFTWMSNNGRTHNHIDHIVIGNGTQVYLMPNLSRKWTVSLMSGGCRS